MNIPDVATANAAVFRTNSGELKLGLFIMRTENDFQVWQLHTKRIRGRTTVEINPDVKSVRVDFNKLCVPWIGRLSPKGLLHESDVVQILTHPTCIDQEALHLDELGSFLERDVYNKMFGIYVEIPGNLGPTKKAKVENTQRKHEQMQTTSAQF
jgi:hypothetical protein